MNKKEKEIISVILDDVCTLDLDKNYPDNEYYYELIKGNLNDLRGGRYMFKTRVKSFIRYIKKYEH